MKRIEIYKEDKLMISMPVDKYDITTYNSSFDIACKIDDIEITYSLPINKGYKIAIEL